MEGGKNWNYPKGWLARMPPLSSRSAPCLERWGADPTTAWSCPHCPALIQSDWQFTVEIKGLCLCSEAPITPLLQRINLLRAVSMFGGREASFPHPRATERSTYTSRSVAHSTQAPISPGMWPSAGCLLSPRVSALEAGNPPGAPSALAGQETMRRPAWQAHSEPKRGFKAGDGGRRGYTGQAGGLGKVGRGAPKGPHLLLV